MRNARSSMILVITLAVVSVVLQFSAGAQTSSPTPKPGAVPRTPWGHPSLDGIWDFRTVTPLERPAELAGKAVLTAEEAAQFEKTAVESRNADVNRGKATRRTVNGTAETEDVALVQRFLVGPWNEGHRDETNSLIVTRRIDSALTPEGKTRLDTKTRDERPAEGPEDRSVGERCMLGLTDHQ